MVQRVNSLHAGNYTCHAWNSLGHNQSQILYIDVRRMLPFRSRFRRVSLARQKHGNRFTHSCSPSRLFVCLFVFFTTNSFSWTGVPVCTLARNEVHYLDIGDTVELPCNVTSHPPPVSYQWTIKRPGHYRELTSNSSVLLYSPWSAIDYGIVQCRSSNTAGRQSDPCKFNIKSKGKIARNQFPFEAYRIVLSTIKSRVKITPLPFLHHRVPV